MGRETFVSRPWFVRLSSVVRSSLVRDSLVPRPWFANRHRGWIGELLYHRFNHYFEDVLLLYKRETI